jgi:hypothetical protein
MSRSKIQISYTLSLLWLAFLIALLHAETHIVELLFIDFVHDNPHRTQENAISMMKTNTPVFAVIALIWTFLVFTLPQFLQAELVGGFEAIFGDRARFAPLLALPVTAVLTWYCYDYLPPSNLCLSFGSCAEAYEHGLSTSRYLTALAVQAPLTLFSFLYFDAALCGQSKIPVLLGALAITLVVGGLRGYLLARGQILFPLLW